MTQALFTATTYFEGEELWITDGTDAGTRMLKAYQPGSENGYVAKIVTAGNLAYVFANDAGGGVFVDVVDTSGAIRTLPIEGFRYANPEGFAKFGNAIYFQSSSETQTGIFQFDLSSSVVTKVYDGNANLCLQTDDALHIASVSDGALLKIAPDGTVSPAFSVDNANGFFYRDDHFFGDLGDRIVFAGQDPQHGSELWVSDDTPGGTGLLKDILGGPVDGIYYGTPYFFTWKEQGLAFFTGKTPGTGMELWVTDGTAAGTHMVKDMRPGSQDTSFDLRQHMSVWGDKVVLATQPNAAYEGYSVWFTDGTEAGTTRFQPSYEGKQLLLSGGSGGGLGVGKYFYFEAEIPSDALFSGVSDTMFFRWNSETNVTELVRNFRTEARGTNYGSEASDAIQGMTPFKDGFLFSAASTWNADIKADNQELWYCDAVAGTVAQVKNIYPGFEGDSGVILSDGSSYPRNFAVFGSTRPTSGDDVLVGGAGHDTVSYGGAGAALGFRAQFAVSGSYASGVTVAGIGAAGTAHGTDMLRGIEQIDFTDGRLVFDGRDPAAIALRMYDATFGRLPDAGGLNYWSAALQRGTSAETMAREFAASPEFAGTYGNLSNQGFVEQLYRNVLDRNGEAGGIAYWSGLLNQGALDRGQMLLGFSESSEHAAKLQPIVDAGLWDIDETAAQAARAYSAAFDRAPDAGGLAFWTSALRKGGMAPSSMADQFVQSGEFTGRYGPLTNEQFVNQLYLNVLDRGADANGAAFWTTGLNTGAMDRGDVLFGFSESAENVAKTAPSMIDGILLA